MFSTVIEKVIFECTIAFICSTRNTAGKLSAIGLLKFGISNHAHGPFKTFIYKTKLGGKAPFFNYYYY